MEDTLLAQQPVDISQFMDQQRFGEAIEVLQKSTNEQSSATHYAALGLAYFKNEQYGLAATCFEKALQLQPGETSWEELLQHASGNDLAEVNIAIPEVYYFEKEKLLAKPFVQEGALPPNPSPAPPPGLLKSLRLVLGDGIGAIFTGIMEGTTILYGKLAGYKGRVWTNWYRRPLFFGILTLAYMREKMNKHNLNSTYPKDTLTGFQPEGQTPPDGVKYFRTADGSWNNLSNPKEGAAGTRFSRNIQVANIKPESGEKLLTPNPREISRKLLTRGPEMKEVPFLNMLAASWIQFENHDWVNHGENLLNEIIDIPLAEDDPARKKYWQTKMMVPRTQP